MNAIIIFQKNLEKLGGIIFKLRLSKNTFFLFLLKVEIFVKLVHLRVFPIVFSFLTIDSFVLFSTIVLLFIQAYNFLLVFCSLINITKKHPERNNNIS